LRSVDPALAEVSEGLAALADWRGAPSGAIRLTTFQYAARSVLAARLPGFLKEHPDVSIEVIVDDRLVDIIESGFDAGIRLGGAIEGDMIAIPLQPELRIVVVATPDYFKRHPKPKVPRDLEAHLCVNYRLTGCGGLLPWVFERESEQVTVRAKGQLIVNDGVLGAAAVRAGAAIGGMIEEEVAEEIADGRLVRVLSEWSRCVPGCHLYYPNRKVTPALRALTAALRWTDSPAQAI
jgi:DNA-binding transcriptional LysR family regulator